jgi:DNA-binding Lrp family transcriptional regulator
MKEKIKKLLFEYSRNSRITTKELGKRMRTSQQSASYLKNQLISKKIIQPTAIVDGVKLGLISVLVGFNFLKPNYELKRELINELKETESIIQIEEGKEGVDLLVEYSTLNLSAFNKLNIEIVTKYQKKLRSVFVLPIIVNHEYSRKYLSRKNDPTDLVLSGDRVLRKLSENERKVLIQLTNSPSKSLIDIAESLKMPVKSILNLKRSLEQKFIIKGYGSILDYNKLNIQRQIIFLRFTPEAMKDLDNFHLFTQNNKNIIKFAKTIGEYQLIIIAESLKDIEVIKDIRSNFPIEKYFIVKSEKIHKKRYLPKENEK